ncbi:glycine dehydrogenase [Acerihabitans sp. KWT182]|uniref:Glycine dehydrogenase n=1 Tax=Acerihabitans sp. KWT182 TaxID=3157919 RepID=A0AAU7QGA4_9GAMM
MSAALTAKVLAEIMEMMKARNIRVNAVQEKMLHSHVRAMVRRSITGEPLPEVDEGLFDDISVDSMLMAKQIVSGLGNLPVEEAYLLSVHFEVAKNNNVE